MKHKILSLLSCSLIITVGAASANNAETAPSETAQAETALVETVSGETVPVEAELSAIELLKASDKARGGGLPGIQWKMDLVTVRPKRDDLRQAFEVIALEENSLATTVFPKRMAGGKLLQVEKNMWFAQPDLRKPISISSRQKISGPAANGDIAATNYALDYDAEIIGVEDFNGQPAYVLNLTAKNKWVTYDQVKYWISKNDLVALKAEFYTVSGKLFKSATFETNNILNFNDEDIPFISKMLIIDALGSGSESTLVYTDVEIVSLSPSDFSRASLTR